MDDLAVTVYVIADFDSHDGLELAKEALKFMVFILHRFIVDDVHRHITGIDTLAQDSGNL